MNLTSADPTAPPPPPPPQPPRSSFSCDRHPDEQFTGFCPSCLCERLNTLDSTANTPSSSSRRPSSVAAAAIKSLFTSNSRAAATNSAAPPPPPKPSRPAASFLPELRRTKSFSASKNEALSLSFEPHRKSCDVRAKNTLWTLFSIDDDKPGSSHQTQHHKSSNKPIESSRVNNPVIEEVENEEDFKDPPENLDDIIVSVDEDGDGDEIRPVEDHHPVEIKVNSSEIVEEEEENDVVAVSNLKAMKDHIDLITQNQVKKSSGGGGGFWSAASVFSKKWLKWRHKQKIKKHNHGKNLSTLPPEKPISSSKRYRETQSEIADYGFGRRSLDIDPRFSLDAPRMSLDNDQRYSFDEPRASWDGYLLGRSFPRMAPPMVSVLEDVAPPPPVRADMHIPLDGPNENVVPGGSAQTRDYYLDSSSRRRKSLERSNSIRKTAAAVVAEIDELKLASSNATKVLPTTADYFRGAKVLDSYPNSMRDDASETFELSGSIVGNNGDKKETTKKSKKWSWKIWGFMHRRNNKDGDDDEKYSKYSSVNGVERSLSQSWQDTRGGSDNRNVLRSNSSVSWRNPNQIGGPFGNPRRSNVETYDVKRKSDFGSDRNRNARYSPNNNLDNGLLRFYLTPVMGNNHRRSVTGGKVKPAHSISSSNSSVARSVMRLY